VRLFVKVIGWGLFSYGILGFFGMWFLYGLEAMLWSSIVGVACIWIGWKIAHSKNK